jgi:hypothetical protein
MKDYNVVYSVFKDGRFIFLNITSERGENPKVAGENVQKRALPFLTDKSRFSIEILDVWEDE